MPNLGEALLIKGESDSSSEGDTPPPELGAPDSPSNEAVPEPLVEPPDSPPLEPRVGPPLVGPTLAPPPPTQEPGTVQAFGTGSALVRRGTLHPSEPTSPTVEELAGGLPTWNSAAPLNGSIPWLLVGPPGTTLGAAPVTASYVELHQITPLITVRVEWINYLNDAGVLMRIYTYLGGIQWFSVDIDVRGRIVRAASLWPDSPPFPEAGNQPDPSAGC